RHHVHPVQPEGEDRPDTRAVLLRLPEPALRGHERRLRRRLGAIHEGEYRPVNLPGDQHTGRWGSRQQRFLLTPNAGRETSTVQPGLMRALTLSAILSGLTGGCGPAESHPETVPVQGKVTYKGQPVPRGTITFQPDAGQPATGEIQPDGSYRLGTYGQD